MSSAKTLTIHPFDWFKLSRGEAVVRLRINALGLLTLTVFTNLLPLPSPWAAISVLREGTPVNSIYYGLCLLGMSLEFY